MTGLHRAALAAGFGALVLLAGCAVQLGQVRSDNAMYNAGFTNDTVSTQTAGGVTTVEAMADPKAPHAPLGSQARAVAKAVWDTLPGRFDRLTVTIRGVGGRTFTHDQLVARFGQRPGTLDRQSLSSGSGADGTVLALVGVGTLVVVGCVVAYSFSRYRRQRARSAAARTALLMSTIPQELWGAAEGPEGLAVGPAPPPPVPAPPTWARSSAPPMPPPIPPPVPPPMPSAVPPAVAPEVPSPVPPPVTPWPVAPPQPGSRDRPPP